MGGRDRSMSYTHYDRLTALDVSFLRFEEQNPAVHMHVGAVALFKPGPLATDEGGIDIDRVRLGVESSLGESPRFRQKLARVPLVDAPVWIDDAHFNLRYHVRHTSLPRPGTMRQLKRLAGRIFSQRLDRTKPLWEFWFVEGLEDGRFALMAKAHHCMVDGISGFDLLARIMRLDQDTTIEPPRGFMPRPAPPDAKLLVDEVQRRVALPLDLAGAGLRALGKPRESLERLLEGSGAVWDALSANLEPVSGTPFNVKIGPYRRFDWMRFDLDAVKAVKQRLGGTVNDVVLACVAGAVGRFLRARGERVEDLRFRAMLPVSVRRDDERGVAGNRVVSLIAPLPIAVEGAAERLAQVVEATQELKRSRQARGVEIFEELADRVSPDLFASVSRRAAKTAYNMVVTNVPGPQATAWLLGAELEEIYPVVPLFDDNALGVALFSYNGSLCWGLSADWEAMPDLHDLTGYLNDEIEALIKSPGPAAS
jgi:diacylglycerol O-acyltransferase